MGRPNKNNASYFTHDADMRNDIKVKALRRKYQHKGYAIWCFYLETLTDCENFEIECEGIEFELLAADFDVAVEELIEITNYCVKIGLLQRNEENGNIFSEAHRNRFKQMLDKRELRREINKINGSKGGNPNFKKGQPNPYLKQMKDNQIGNDNISNITNNNQIGNNEITKDNPNKIKEKKENAASKEASSKKCGTDVPLSPSLGEGDASFSTPAVSLKNENESSQGIDDNINYNELIKFWNETTNGIYGRLVCIENKRRAMTRARIREYGKENFAKAIENAARSDFLRGATWFNYDWLICPNNFVKVLENRYTQNGNTKTSTNANAGFDIKRAIRNGFGLAAADFAGGGG